jgi:thiol-disulfide isomerase/thioredoxin
MKIGNIAPDILFAGDVYKNGSAIKSPSRLSEVAANYKVVVFGASWCPSCAEEMAQLLPLYGKWKAKGIEVVFISLDTDKKAFQDFTSILPFISTCDYKKWDTQAAKDYFVFASPTIFLLDNTGKIKFRPKSIAHLEAFINTL